MFFTTTADNVSALERVQWVYLAIAIFVFCLAAVFYISDIPEVTDADMEYQVALTHVEDNNDSFWKKYQLFHAAFAQFLYVGSQGTCNYSIAIYSMLPVACLIKIPSGNCFIFH